MTPSSPTTVEELVDVLASTAPAPVRIAGAGTKRPARPADVEGTPVLDLRRLVGLAAYDPAECVVTAWAGTPVAEVAAALAAHGQYLPWDPPLVEQGATIGGMVASGLNGSGRYRYGGVRDFVIGARVVDGRGRLIASGGQVVKNAAGFLTHHALVGSAGRLGVIADVSFKVFPRPEARTTVVARAGSMAEALAAHDRLRLANLDIEALDVDVTAAAVCARLAGAPDALPARTERAARALALPVEVVTGQDDATLWADVAAFGWAPAGSAIVKLPTVPSRIAEALAALEPLGPRRVACGGAVVFAATQASDAAIRNALAGGGWRGAIVRGEACGTVVGANGAGPFDERVLATLDPERRFR